MRSLFAAGCVAAVLSTPSSASAWTDASVRALDASLETREGGATHMALEIDVEVHGGWLTEIEVPSLGEGVVLDAQKPAWAVLPDGRKLVPVAVVGEDGSLRFRFDRTNAPRRGRITLGASLDMTLADEGALHWEPPMWQSGLDGVRVRWSVPASRRFLQASVGDSPEDVRIVRAGDRQVLEAYRPHLPRGTEWHFEFAGGEPSEDRVLTSPAAFDESKWPYLALFLFVLAIGAARRATAKSSHVALSGLPTTALVATAIGLAGASLALDELRATLFLVALGLTTIAFTSRARSARAFDGTGLLGASTWFTASALGVAYTLAVGAPHLRVLGAALPLLLVPLFYAKSDAASLATSPEVAPSTA